MVRRALIAPLSLFLLAPAWAEAQERAQPQERAPQERAPQQQMQQEGVTLVVSQWKCDWREMDTLLQAMRDVQEPVWERLVNEGLLISAGTFIHNWGDEWNFNMYRIAPDEQTFLRAYAAEGPAAAERVAEMGLPADTPSPVQEHCTEHKDNIYTMYPGPEAQGPPQP